MAFDGSGVEEGDAQETSLTLGVFAYRGIDRHDNMNVDRNRYGLDVGIWYSNLNLLGGFISGSDLDGEEKYSLYFVEADYALYPWLRGILRYENANPKNLPDVSQLVANLSALYVANIKFMLETRLNPDDIDFDNLYVGMDFAF
jgi:hypothetical protein